MLFDRAPRKNGAGFRYDENHWGTRHKIGLQCRCLSGEWGPELHTDNAGSDSQLNMRTAAILTRHSTNVQ
jgi:hypothetical protein